MVLFWGPKVPKSFKIEILKLKLKSVIHPTHLNEINKMMDHDLVALKRVGDKGAVRAMFLKHMATFSDFLENMNFIDIPMVGKRFT